MEEVAADRPKPGWFLLGCVVAAWSGVAGSAVLTAIMWLQALWGGAVNPFAILSSIPFMACGMVGLWIEHRAVVRQDENAAHLAYMGWLLVVFFAVFALATNVVSLNGKHPSAGFVLIFGGICLAIAGGAFFLAAQHRYWYRELDEYRKRFPKCRCGYELHGSIVGGRSACPECGEAITARLPTSHGIKPRE